MPDQIQIDSFMLADAAKVFEGKLYVHGGGWNFLNLLERGAERAISIAGRVLIPWSDEAREITLEIHLEHREEETILERVPILQIKMKSEPYPGVDRALALESATPFAFDIPGVAFYASGEYSFVISDNGEELSRTRFQVNISPPTQPD